MDTFMKKTAALVCGTLALAATANAAQLTIAPPLPKPMPNVVDGGNMWLLTGYVDWSNNHQPQGTHIICFLPPRMNINGRLLGSWYSMTFSDWNGIYYQEGDEIKMTGDFRHELGHDHLTLYHTTYDEPGRAGGIAFKDWTEWLGGPTFGDFVLWGNAKMERIGKCRFPFDLDEYPNPDMGTILRLEQQALEFSQTLPERLETDGDIAPFPSSQDMESVKTYLERNGFN